VRTVSKLVKFRHSFSVSASIAVEFYFGLYNCDLFAWNTGRITDLIIDGSALLKWTSKKLDVKCSLSTPWRHTVGEEMWICPFLTSALHGGERLTSLTGRFASGEITWYPLKMRQAGAQSGSGHFGIGKSLLPLSEFETQTVQYG